MSRKLKNGVCTGEEMLHKYFEFNGVANTLVIACAKLFKKSLFLDLSFAVGRLHEDEYLYFPMYSKVGKVAFTEAFLYNYVQRKGSIINSKVSAKRVEDLCGLWNGRLAKYKGEMELYRKMTVGYALQVFAVIDRVEEPDVVSKLSTVYREQIRNVLCKCIDLPFHIKVAYLLIAISPRKFATLIHRR